MATGGGGVGERQQRLSRGRSKCRPRGIGNLLGGREPLQKIVNNGARAEQLLQRGERPAARCGDRVGAGIGPGNRNEAAGTVREVRQQNGRPLADHLLQDGQNLSTERLGRPGDGHFR